MHMYIAAGQGEGAYLGAWFGTRSPGQQLRPESVRARARARAADARPHSPVRMRRLPSTSAVPHRAAGVRSMAGGCVALVARVGSVCPCAAARRITVICAGR